MPLDLTKLEEQNKLINLYRERQSQHIDDFFEKVTTIFGEDFECTLDDGKRVFTNGLINFVVTTYSGKEYDSLEFTVEKRVWGKNIESFTLKDATKYLEDAFVPYRYMFEIDDEKHLIDESKIEPFIQVVLDANL